MFLGEEDDEPSRTDKRESPDSPSARGLRGAGKGTVSGNNS